MLNQYTNSHFETKEYDEINGLTDKEEQEVNLFLVGTCYKLNNTDECIENLFKKLQNLDGENIIKVLSSEHQVNKLVHHISDIIDKSYEIEKRLEEYDNSIDQVRSTMEAMGEKNTVIEQISENTYKLQNELDDIFQKLNLNYDSFDNMNIEQITEIGKRVIVSSSYDIDKGLLRLTSICEQKKKVEKIKTKYCQSVSRHLNNLFIHIITNEKMTSNPKKEEINEIVEKIHNSLKPYCNLIPILKTIDESTFDGLFKVKFKIILFFFENEHT